MTAPNSTLDRLGKFPEGPRSADRHRQFLDDPVADHLLRAAVTLAMELSVTRERLASLEALLAQRGVIGTDALAEFAPNDADLKNREQAREKLIADLIGPLVASLSQADQS